MAAATEAFSRVKIDALLEDAGWNLTDGASVLFEHALPGGSRADYALCDRAGRPMAVIEAKRASIEPPAARDQGVRYATLLEVPVDKRNLWSPSRNDGVEIRNWHGGDRPDPCLRPVGRGSGSGNGAIVPPPRRRLLACCGRRCAAARRTCK